MSKFMRATSTALAFGASPLSLTPQEQSLAALVAPIQFAEQLPANPLVATNSDPLKAAVDARMRERLLLMENSAQQLSNVPPGIDALARERLSTERVAKTLQQTLEALLLEAPRLPLPEVSEKIGAAFKEYHPTSEKCDDKDSIRDELLAAVSAGNFLSALQTLHAHFAHLYPSGFTEPQATPLKWQTAVAILTDLTRLDPEAPSDIVDDQSLALVRLLEQIFPDRYVGQTRTQMLHPDQKIRRNALLEETAFLGEQYRRAFP